MIKQKLIVIFFFIILNSSGQSNPGIQYDFTHQIDSIIHDGIEKSLLNNGVTLDERHGYFILLNSTCFSDSTIVLYLSYYFKYVSPTDSAGNITDWLQYLIENSNRYTTIINRDIPIILKEDLFFGILGKGFDKEKGEYNIVEDLRFESVPRIEIYVEKKRKGQVIKVRYIY